jgi:hypothetical protein
VNHANHSTCLVYAHDRGELEAGTVTNVPRQGDTVTLLVDGERCVYRVTQVEWDVFMPVDPVHGTRFTRARCILSRIG